MAHNKNNFSVHILGAYSAKPPLGKHQTAQYIDKGQHAYLLDCGEGTQFRLPALGLSPAKIKAIFISHLHGDHYLGLLGLLSSMSMDSRSKELHIFAPKGLSEILTLQMHFSQFYPEFHIEFKEINLSDKALIYEDLSIEVYAFPLLHRITCYGFLICEKKKHRNIIAEKIPEGFPFALINYLKNGEDVEWNKTKYTVEDMTAAPLPALTYAYCTDTRPFDVLPDFVGRADLLYHDATFSEIHAEKASETFHSTARQAAFTAKKAGAKKLLLGHFSSRYPQLTPLLEEAKTIFEESYIAEEGGCFDISHN
jgi:ribonuclease Z